MPHVLIGPGAGPRLPSWVPSGARAYLAHIEGGLTIRELARRNGQHASTVLRQIRKFETRRDDPLIDAALRTLGREYKTAHPAHTQFGKAPMPSSQTETALPSNDANFQQDAARILRRLCEAGAVLAVAADMEKAVVVREGATGGSQRTAVVDRALAEALALNGWISAAKPGRITRYEITAAGRAALEKMVQAAGPAGFAEAPAAFAGAEPAAEDLRHRRLRYGVSDSPLVTLARRRDKDGTPFLDDRLVSAGERLREDFELANMGPKVAQNWDRFLDGGARGTAPVQGSGPEAARSRVAAALTDLGPGLSDVALRCCCYLEGLETAEKKLGWSARSGKIVLRIALHRLQRHYEDTYGAGGGLIG
ncbi:MAG: DUF6456 domain-containing protein [Pseudomonadota bacterium]